jgi:hypothetical protein
MERTILIVLLAAGAAHASEPIQPQLAPLGTMPSRHVAHMYYNIATGEKVATLLGDDLRPSDKGVSSAVWISDNGLPCGPQSSGGIGVAVVDETFCPFSGSSCFDPQIYLDWGDIATDQVIDCVGITWSTQYTDSDLDGDGLGDGVPGLGATWSWYDAENGFDSSDTRLGLASLTLFNLPGMTGTFDPDLFATYTATVDLASSLDSSLVFEIGDTDSIDGSGAGNFNPGAGADLDGDGLADFGYALQYIRPGTVDFDGDGVPDGEPFPRRKTGWRVAVPPGQPEQNGDGSWSFVPDAPPAGQGVEDAFDIFIDFDNDGVFEPIGTFWFGGFSCDANGDGVIGDTTSYAQFDTRMYGPNGGCVRCPADIFPDDGAACGGGDGLLNFFDISTFIGWFNSQDPRADVFPGSVGDGVFNFFDVNLFIGAFSAGCP